MLDIGPQTAATLAAQLRRGRHHRLERPGGRVRDGAVRGRHARVAQAIADSPAFSIAGGGDTLAAIAKYGIESRSATSRPVAAPSSRCSRARPCRPSRCWPPARPAEPRSTPALLGAADGTMAAHPRRPHGPSRHQDRRHARPGIERPALLEQMIRAGVNVVRLNFSHGQAQDHIERARLVREAAQRAGREVAIMADLQGPKIRVGRFAQGRVMLEPGALHHGRGPHRARRRARRRAGLQVAAARGRRSAIRCCSTTA